MTPVRLTAAQLRALMWLPADGGWRRSDNSISGALESLRYGQNVRRVFLVDRRIDLRPFYYRLTPAGIEERRKREQAG